MKTIRIHLLILIALIGVVVYQSLIHQGSIRQAQTLNQSLEAHLDTLQYITTQYQHIHENYEALYEQLLYSQHSVSELSRDLTRIADHQQRDAMQIRDSLRQILVDYDTLTPNPMLSHHKIPSP